MIEVRNITKKYGELEVLKSVSFNVSNGEIVSIIGASGAGKSTLLNIIGTLDSATSGSVTVAGTNISSLSGDTLAQFRNSNIGFVFQFHHLLPEFSALENVMLPALIKGTPKDKCEARAKQLLELLSVSSRAQHKPSQLSGGEAQRVAIARAVINNPAVVLADEPSGNLDSQSRTELYNALTDLRDKEGTTIIIVTHDTALANISDRTIEIIDGRII